MATFAGCQITGTAAAGTYTLKGTGGGLTSANSTGTVTITAGAATKLTFSTPPGGTVGEGATFATQPVLTAKDANGNTVSGFTDAVTLNITGYTAGGGGHTQGSLAGATNPVTAVAGVATFAGCQITGTGGRGHLHAQRHRRRPDRDHRRAPSPSRPEPATQLVFTTQPGGTVGEGAAFTQPTLTAEDANGNTVTGFAEHGHPASRHLHGG